MESSNNLLQEDDHLIRVKNETEVGKLSSYINKQYAKEPNKSIVLRAVGAFALNQATKAIIIANKSMVLHGIQFLVSLSFHSAKDERVPEGQPEKRYTAVNLTLKPYKL